MRVIDETDEKDRWELHFADFIIQSYETIL